MADVDCCVVGAGFAGFGCRIAAQAGRSSVALLEARDRVGGRTYTEVLDDGTWIDRGGAWIGPGQDRIKALMTEFGAAEYKEYVDGDAMMILDGKQHRYSGTIPWAMSPWAIANLGAGLLEVELMCRSIPFDAPWEAKKAVEWDRITRWGSGSIVMRSGRRGDARYGVRRHLHLGGLGRCRCCGRFTRWGPAAGRSSSSPTGRRAGRTCARRYGCHLRADGRRNR